MAKGLTPIPLETGSLFTGKLSALWLIAKLGADDVTAAVTWGSWRLGLGDEDVLSIDPALIFGLTASSEETLALAILVVATLEVATHVEVATLVGVATILVGLTTLVVLTMEVLGLTSTECETLDAD